MTLARGKYGVLEMGFEQDSLGRTVLRHLHREVPLIVQQALYFDESLPTMACVYILSSGGPNLDGDRFEVEVELGKETMAHISTGAATVIASMEHDCARQRQSITLDEGAYLEWLPRPMIPCAHSRYGSTTELIVAPSATLIFSEVVACGRLHSGECFDYDDFSPSTLVCRPSGEVVVRDALRLIPSHHSPTHWALLGEHTHFGSVVIISPAKVTAQLYAELHPEVTEEFSLSVARLAEDAGLIVRLTGLGSERILRAIRSLCSLLRFHTKGVTLPREFPWR
ncbi:MAG: urease accessory protein UreD [Tidjanibacter sp.]|nr:urease accessory protein UreD [Tidjanibacter sp.]